MGNTLAQGLPYPADEPEAEVPSMKNHSGGIRKLMDDDRCGIVVVWKNSEAILPLPQESVNSQIGELVWLTSLTAMGVYWHEYPTVANPIIVVITNVQERGEGEAGTILDWYKHMLQWTLRRAHTTRSKSQCSKTAKRVREWPEATLSFYFVKIRSFEDPNLREKIVEAENEFQKKIKARNKIIEVARAKEEECSDIISELASLFAENKQYHVVVEVLQNHLGKFRDGNNTMQAQNCSVVEELEQTIKMLSDRIVYECISLLEEKRLYKEIKDIEKAMSKIIYLSTNRAKLQGTADGNEATQDKVKVIDRIRKEQQAIGSKIKVLEDELNVVNAEIRPIQEDLGAATARKDRAYEPLQELRAKRDAKNAMFVQNRGVLIKARDYASRGMVKELQGFHKTEVDEFMARWCRSKAFREDYEARVLSSLNGRQLDRDGRTMTPDQ